MMSAEPQKQEGRTGVAMSQPLMRIDTSDATETERHDLGPTITAALGGQSGEMDGNIWDRVTFRWLNRLIALGNQRQVQYGQSQEHVGEHSAQMDAALTEADLYELRDDDQPDEIEDRIRLAWESEMTKRPADRSLFRAFRDVFGTTFYEAGGYKFAYDTLQMVGPFVLKRFLGFLQRCDNNPQECRKSEGFLYVLVLMVSALTQTALLQQYFHRCFRTGMRLNCASICLIYSKSLKIAGPGRASEGSQSNTGSMTSATLTSTGSLAGLRERFRSMRDLPDPALTYQRTSGEIVNLMSTDSQRLQDFCPYCQILWSGPYAITITLIFLSFTVGWATLAGLAVMLLNIPITTLISRKVKEAQKLLMKVKDERMKVSNEVFSAIRLLKMYGWEDSFRERLDAIRERELTQLRKYQILNVISNAVSQSAPLLTGAATFGAYTVFYGKLDAATAFTALSLFNVLRFPLFMLPNMINSCAEANVALQRIQNFLQTPEIKGRPASPQNALENAVENVVTVDKAQLDWPDTTPLLKDVTFKVPAAIRGQERAHLTVIVGAVGTGKSGLLQALIGDLSPKTDGTVSVVGTIAYASQVAWVRNATVKENILFNSYPSDDRYQAVLEACCLLPDLKDLPDKDETEIGEKGVNLSGGQKQRIALARAIYASPKLLLLDDVLSAVDSEVAKNLLKTLRGPLVAGSSIVLCTHYVSAIKSADQVVLLERTHENAQDHGQVRFCGTPDEFEKTFPDYIPSEGSGFQRNLSGVSEASEGELQDVPLKASSAARLVEKETEYVGSVPFSVYKMYMEAAGGVELTCLVLGGVALAQALQTSADSWVSYWSDHSKELEDQVYISSTTGLLGYVAFSLASFVGIVCTSALFRLTAINAARYFHKKLLETLLCLPMDFFDTTPLGRVINRLNKDTYTIDEQLQQTLFMYLSVLVRVLATIIVVAVATPWFLAVVVPLLFVYRSTQNYYIPSSRQLKRIESTLRSPVFSHFAETLDGLSSIRAFGQKDQFKSVCRDRLRRQMRAYYLNVASNRWLAVRLETLGCGIVTSAGLLAVFGAHSISAGVAGLSITYALNVTQSLNWVVRMTSDRETNIVSVERVSDYINLPREPPRICQNDPDSRAWPKHGAITFRNVTVRYRGGQNILNDLSFTIPAGERVGVCGRTGAGKSTLLNVLLRIVEPAKGTIEIDDVNICKIGLHRLRRSIAIIPQDPVLFSGTLRFNLDPLEEVGDGNKIMTALERAHVKHHVASSSSSGLSCLESQVDEKGQNFSLGQRQQLCLARALLRESNRILLLDEATSAVDLETDENIQKTIRTEFTSQTILCIAHRISTIMDSDWILVLEKGRLAETGQPSRLMEHKDSKFRKLAKLDTSGR